MEQRHKALLLAKRLEITSDLRFKHIRRHLVDHGILNGADLDEIENHETREDEVKALLDILPTRGPNAFTVFRDALKNSYPHLARVLQDEPPIDSRMPEPRVFVIHAGEDKESFVRPLVTELQQQGLAEKDIFFDDVSIEPGDVIRDRILSTLSSQTLELAVIVVSTSFLNKPYWPRLEYETCLKNRKRIFPIWVDDNKDNFKTFSVQVGKYSPTLKQLSARRVQEEDVTDELTNIAAGVVKRLSTLESGVSEPTAIQTLLCLAPSPFPTDSGSSDEDDSIKDHDTCSAGVTDEQQIEDKLKDDKEKHIELLGKVGGMQIQWLKDAESLLPREKIERKTEDMLDNLSQYSLHILKVKMGCAIVHLVPDTLAALEVFWRDYRSGQLSITFSDYLITDEMRTVVGKDLMVRVIMLEEQYRQWKRYFLRETAVGNQRGKKDTVEESGSTWDVPESPGISQDKRTAPQDTKNGQPRRHSRMEAEGTFVSWRYQEALPDNDQRYYIMENAGSKWKNLARKLGFKESDIVGFEVERELQERCMKMLTAWKLRMGDSGTLSVLKKALVNAGLKDIADNLDMQRGQDSFSKGMDCSDNQQIAEQGKQDKPEIQIGIRIDWQERAEKALAALQGKDTLAGATGVRDISTTATSSSGSMDINFFVREGMPKFHSKVHGKQISIAFSDGIIAQSHDSFNDGICFSSMPIKVGKKTNLKIIVSRTFNESMRFGYTCRDPNTLSVEELPPHSYPTLAQQPGFWVKPLPANLAHLGCVVTFTVDQSGNANFAVDGEDKGLFFSGVDVSKPLWAVVDLHGSTVAVQFVGLEAVSEAFEQRIHEGDQVQMWVEDMDTLRDMQDGHGGFDSDMEEAVGQIGIALKVDGDGDVHVSFPSFYSRWCMNSAALRKVDRPDIRSTAIIGGDLVKITPDLEKLKGVQKGKSLWLERMEKIPGKIGRAAGVGPGGEIGVKVVGEGTDMMIFDPCVLEKTENQADMCTQGLHHWKRGVSKVCVSCGECTGEGDECGMKGKPLRHPRSCCGCARTDAGCADCGLCKTCAGLRESDGDILGQLKSLLRPLEDLVGLSAGLSGLSLEEDEPNEYGLKRGDEVLVNVDKDIFRRLQQENALPWTDDMVKVIGLPGTIVARLLRNDVAVQFQNDTMEIIFSGCLTKTASGVPDKQDSRTQDKQGPFKAGDLVKLVEDENKLKMLQKLHGGYNDKMQYCLGKTGCVKKVRKLQVQVKFLHLQSSFWYNPEALTKVSSEEQQKTVCHLKQGDCVKVAVDTETLKANQLCHGGPVDHVSKVMETAGVVHHLDIDGDPFICFQNGFRRFINPASLEKVNPEDYQGEDSSELKEEEWVKVDADKAKIKQVQKATVPWNNGYYAAAGKIGVLQNIAPSGSFVHVAIPSAGAGFPLHRSLVKKASLVDMQEYMVESTKGSDFARGDLVKIAVSLVDLKGLQEGHGGYKIDMEKVITEAGSVSFIDSEGDIHVRFGLKPKRLCFNPEALTKVTTTEDKFYVGDLVQIESDLERFKALQTPKEHGKYVEDMAKVCGKTGRLLSFVDSKKARVKVQGRAWIFNPDLLKRIGNPGTHAESWKSATICARGEHNWSMGRCLVCVVCGECTSEGKLCPAKGMLERTPGSVAGCGSGDAGCDDCGACRSCAGEEVEEEQDLLKSGKLQEIIKKTVVKTLKKEAEKKLAVDDAKTVVEKHRQSESEGEEEERMGKMLGLLDRMTQVVELIRKGKDFDSIEKVKHALIQHIDIPFSQSTSAVKKQLGDYLANIGAAEALMEYGHFLLSQASQHDGTDAKALNECLVLLYGVVNNCAYSSSEFNHTLGRSGLLQITVQELARRYDLEKSDANQEWIQLLVTTLGNCARVAENKDYLRDIDVVDLLKKHLSNEDMVLKVVTLSCLAHIVDADELPTIQLQAEDTEFFMNTLKTALGDASHATSFGVARMSAKDFVKDLTALSRNDDNKLAFVERGVTDALIDLIESDSDTEKECAMLCVQRFAMVDSIRNTIVSETRVEEVLRALLTQDQKYAVQAAARKTLKCLQKEPSSS